MQETDDYARHTIGAGNGGGGHATAIPDWAVDPEELDASFSLMRVSARRRQYTGYTSLTTPARRARTRALVPMTAVAHLA